MADFVRCCVRGQLPQPLPVAADGGPSTWNLEVDVPAFYDGFMRKLEPATTYELRADTPENFEKARIFFRCLGALLTDGDVPVGENAIRFCIPIDLDRAELERDWLKLHASCSASRLGKELRCHGLPARAIRALDGVAVGERIHDEEDHEWPDCVTDAALPLPLLCEFLSGLMGGDGGIPGLINAGPQARQAPSFSGCKFHHVACYHDSHWLPQLRKMQTLVELFHRVGVDASVYTHQPFTKAIECDEDGNMVGCTDEDYVCSKHGKKHRGITISIPRIGELATSGIFYAYCSYKQIRFELALQHARYKALTDGQKLAIFEYVTANTRGAGARDKQALLQTAIDLESAKGVPLMSYAYTENHESLRSSFSNYSQGEMKDEDPSLEDARIRQDGRVFPIWLTFGARSFELCGGVVVDDDENVTFVERLAPRAYMHHDSTRDVTAVFLDEWARDVWDTRILCYRLVQN
jgi:hypothetical protein